MPNFKLKGKDGKMSDMPVKNFRMKIEKQRFACKQDEEDEDEIICEPLE